MFSITRKLLSSKTYVNQLKIDAENNIKTIMLKDSILNKKKVN